MYAAAGGASLASRQARKRQQQQQQKNKTNALLQQNLAAKAAHQARVAGVSTPTRAQQSRQFHQLPQSYLKAPHAQGRKLSAGYTTQSKLLLPINEGQQNGEQVGQAGQKASQDPMCNYDRRRKAMTKSATATFPLNSRAEITPPNTPTVCFRSLHPPGESAKYHLGHMIDSNQQTQVCGQNKGDSIIVTPATPLPSPGPPTAAQLERKCSVYRNRKMDAYEDRYYKECDYAYQDEIGEGGVPNYGGLPNGGNGTNKWNQPDYCDAEHRHLGICTCDHSECAQGRAAWLERGRRCSVPENPASCHRRWVKRNRIHDSSLGGSSDDEDLLGVLRGPSSFANAFLYVGLGTIAIGLVIAFVGTGEKGFKTVELRLIGPSLIVIGLICCILRIFFCICPSHCISSTRRARNKKTAKIDADHTTSLLRGDNKRVLIARGPNSQPKPTQIHKSLTKQGSKTGEGMEALRHIASTSLFLQNEQRTTAPSNRIVPIINEPDRREEASLEMKKIDSMSIDICSISDDDSDNDLSKVVEAGTTVDDVGATEQHRQSKLSKQRAPLNQQKLITPTAAPSLTARRDSDSLLMETSLMMINPTPTSTPPHYQHLALPLSTQSTSSLFAAQTTIGVAAANLTSTAAQTQPYYPTTHSTMTIHEQSAISGNTIGLLHPHSEQELVLSPAKLGQ